MDGRNIGEIVIYAIDGSFDGFLTVIYGHFYRKWRPADIVNRDVFQQTLGASYVYVETDVSEAAKVFAAVREKISPEAAERCHAAFLSGEPRILTPLYRYVVRGFSMGAAIDGHLCSDDVLAVHKTAGRVLDEAHLHIEFIRFAETDTGVYYADISPAYDLLPLLAPHFIDRFMNHPWIIHDVSRGRVLVYNGKECLLTDAPKNASVKHSDSEESFQALWTAFYNAIAVESRRNAGLQRHMLPMRFRKHMTEWKSKQ